MSNQKTISITVDVEGHVQIEGHGFHGPDCQKVMRELQVALGDGEVTHLRRKPEFFERVQTVNRQTVGGGGQ